MTEYKTEKEFANGIYFKKHDKQPDFVVGSVSIKIEEFRKFLDTKKDEWLNLKILKSRDKGFYIEVDNWKPDNTKPKKEVTGEDSQGYEKEFTQKVKKEKEPLDYGEEVNPDDIPF
jgi:hypothetical protein